MKLFHLLMLFLVLGITFVSWHGYKPHEDERTALKWDAGFAIWFLFLLLAAGPSDPRSGPSGFVGAGFLVIALALAINARRLFLGWEYLFVKHPAEHAVSSALRSGEPIDGSAISGVVSADEPEDVLFPSLHARFNARRAERARALRDKLNADAELAEAIVRRERARAEARETQARSRD